jgi:predicted O-methyltransferase YrrM
MSKEMSKYKFDPEKDWFTPMKPNFERHLSRYIGKPVNFLEIGSFEGRSAIWFLDNILTHDDARLTCIDCWKDTNNYHTFINNIADHQHKVEVIVEESVKALRKLDDQFDFIYIDADHRGYHPLEDAVLAWPLLKQHGVLCFDDYGWLQADVTIPIDAFLSVYKEVIEIIQINYQVWIARKNINDQTQLHPQI